LLLALFEQLFGLLHFHGLFFVIEACPVLKHLGVENFVDEIEHLELFLVVDENVLSVDIPQ